MNFVSVIMLVFSMIGAFDRIIGNKLGLSKEFEKGFMLLGNMSLSMIGMIIISPLIADSLSPVFDFVLDVLHVDPSIIPASLFANDMGGAPLSKEIASDESVGMFNALVVSSMMGCTVSFTIPYALGIVEKRMHKSVFLGFLCGIVTIPVGCIAAGLLTNIGLKAFAINLLPLVLLSGIIAVGLILCPSVCVKIFSVFGIIIKTLITVGLALGIFRFLSGKELISGLATIEEGAAVCLNAAIVMTGAFPLNKVFKITDEKHSKRYTTVATVLSCTAGMAFNVVADPLVGYFYKMYIMGVPQKAADAWAKMGAATTLVNAIIAVISASILYAALRPALKQANLMPTL